ncbi:hypothetical protein KI387_025253 [Taxus chinensis]|uniref:Homeobox domain-containing protein n=1 Tax=Taxus chinensis TaxID=29808 RepID=A0AA38LAD4_TAXCH|nr:hypothetical protein KI387_025253 [Taxus chinensis]
MSSVSDNGGNSFCKRLRPLIPKPLPESLELQHHHSSAANLGGKQMETHHFHQNFSDIRNNHLLSTGLNRSSHVGSSQQPVTSRWNPTPEQLRVLEDLYKRGLRTPSAEQIQYITAQLRCYGKIEGKNVFYWFQNHKARERQKQRRKMEIMMCAENIDFPTNTKIQPNESDWKINRRLSSATNNFQESQDFLKLAVPSTDQQVDYASMQINYSCMPYTSASRDSCGQCLQPCKSQTIKWVPSEEGSSAMNRVPVIDEEHQEGVVHDLKTLELFPLHSNNSKTHDVKTMTDTTYCQDDEFQYEDQEDDRQQEGKAAPCNSYFQFLPLHN